MADLPPIKGFHSSSLLDWAGRLSAVLFLPGCNFRCPFCHAAHLVLCSENLDSIPYGQVEWFLRSRRSWVDGVVISGGEPTLWGEGLDELTGRIRALGYEIKLDTNGSSPETLERLIRLELIQAVSMDLKGPLDERYHLAAGRRVDLTAIRRSIEILCASSLEVEFRTTVCPSLHSPQDIADTAKAVAGGRFPYVLQGFRPAEECLNEDLAGGERAPASFVEAAANAASQWVPHVQIRGQFDFKPVSGLSPVT